MNKNGRIAVLASGSGSNFEALAQAFATDIALLVCNRPEAFALERAKKYNINSIVFDHNNYPDRPSHERVLTDALKEIPSLKVIVLAGYMRILTKHFFENLRDFTSQGGHIINLHPAHLDDYKGPNGYGYAVSHHYPRWGLSVHEVTEVLDTGTVLGSVEFAVYPEESEVQLRERVRPLEHGLLVSVVRELLKA
jgi:phosphoribosylglycinamide formyltransferase-1